MRRQPVPLRRRVARFFAPSALLLVGVVMYGRAGSVNHFFLHASMGFDLALVLLLIGASCGRPQGRFDGVLPVALIFYAQLPDVIYVLGPYHRDWMDVFLFHVGIDEILPLAVTALATLWFVLVVTYLWTLTQEATMDTTHR